MTLLFLLLTLWVGAETKEPGYVWLGEPTGIRDFPEAPTWFEHKPWIYPLKTEPGAPRSYIAIVPWSKDTWDCHISRSKTWEACGQLKIDGEPEAGRETELRDLVIVIAERIGQQPPNERSLTAGSEVKLGALRAKLGFPGNTTFVVGGKTLIVEHAPLASGDTIDDVLFGWLVKSASSELRARVARGPEVTDPPLVIALNDDQGSAFLLRGAETRPLIKAWLPKDLDDEGQRQWVDDIRVFVENAEQKPDLLDKTKPVELPACRLAEKHTVWNPGDSTNVVYLGGRKKRLRVNGLESLCIDRQDRKTDLDRLEAVGKAHPDEQELWLLRSGTGKVGWWSRSGTILAERSKPATWEVVASSVPEACREASAVFLDRQKGEELETFDQLLSAWRFDKNKGQGTLHVWHCVPVGPGREFTIDGKAEDVASLRKTSVFKIDTHCGPADPRRVKLVGGGIQLACTAEPDPGSFQRFWPDGNHTSPFWDAEWSPDLNTKRIAQIEQIAPPQEGERLAVGKDALLVCKPNQSEWQAVEIGLEGKRLELQGSTSRESCAFEAPWSWAIKKPEIGTAGPSPRVAEVSDDAVWMVPPDGNTRGALLRKQEPTIDTHKVPVGPEGPAPTKRDILASVARQTTNGPSAMIWFSDDAFILSATQGETYTLYGKAGDQRHKLEVERGGSCEIQSPTYDDVVRWMGRAHSSGWVSPARLLQIGSARIALARLQSTPTNTFEVHDLGVNVRRGHLRNLTPSPSGGEVCRALTQAAQRSEEFWLALTNAGRARLQGQEIVITRNGSETRLTLEDEASGADRLGSLEALVLPSLPSGGRVHLRPAGKVAVFGDEKVMLGDQRVNLQGMLTQETGKLMRASLIEKLEVHDGQPCRPTHAWSDPLAARDLALSCGQAGRTHVWLYPGDGSGDARVDLEGASGDALATLVPELPGLVRKQTCAAGERRVARLVGQGIHMACGNSTEGALWPDRRAPTKRWSRAIWDDKAFEPVLARLGDPNDNLRLRGWKGSALVCEGEDVNERARRIVSATQDFSILDPRPSCPNPGQEWEWITQTLREGDGQLAAVGGKRFVHVKAGGEAQLVFEPARKIPLRGFTFPADRDLAARAASVLEQGPVNAPTVEGVYRHSADAFGVLRPSSSPELVELERFGAGNSPTAKIRVAKSGACGFSEWRAAQQVQHWLDAISSPTWTEADVLALGGRAIAFVSDGPGYALYDLANPRKLLGRVRSAPALLDARPGGVCQRLGAIGALGSAPFSIFIPDPQRVGFSTPTEITLERGASRARLEVEADSGADRFAVLETLLNVEPPLPETGKLHILPSGKLATFAGGQMRLGNYRASFTEPTFDQAKRVELAKMVSAFGDQRCDPNLEAWTWANGVALRCRSGASPLWVVQSGDTERTYRLVEMPAVESEPSLRSQLLGVLWGTSSRLPECSSGVERTVRALGTRGLYLSGCDGQPETGSLWPDRDRADQFWPRADWSANYGQVLDRLGAPRPSTRLAGWEDGVLICEETSGGLAPRQIVSPTRQLAIEGLSLSAAPCSLEEPWRRVYGVIRQGDRKGSLRRLGNGEIWFDSASRDSLFLAEGRELAVHGFESMAVLEQVAALKPDAKVLSAHYLEAASYGLVKTGEQQTKQLLRYDGSEKTPSHTVEVLTDGPWRPRRLLAPHGQSLPGRVAAGGVRRSQ